MSERSSKNIFPSQVASTAEPHQVTKLAPVALFVYNRPEHTRRTVEALQRNEIAKHSNLFVFADGPRNDAATAGVQEVRKFMRGIEGFRSVRMVEREVNFGLSKSIIDGVTQLCREFGRAIVVEDDVLIAPDFLAFINRGLERYAEEPAVFSVCGFNYPIAAPHSYTYDAFFSYRFACWGWGTWRDRWEKADWLVRDFPEFMADRRQQERFNRGGDQLTWMLARNMDGKNPGFWDIVWAYTHFKHDAVALLPVVSRAYNIGFDGSGIHRRAPFVQASLAWDRDDNYRFPNSTEPDLYFAAQIRRLHRVSPGRKLAHYLFDKLKLGSS